MSLVVISKVNIKRDYDERIDLVASCSFSEPSLVENIYNLDYVHEIFQIVFLVDLTVY